VCGGDVRVRGLAYVLDYEHGNDSLFYTAVEKDSLIAVLWHISCFSN